MKRWQRIILVGKVKEGSHRVIVYFERSRLALMLFLFDMDNVLYDYQWRIRMDRLTESTGHDFHELRRRWWHDDGEWAAEAGHPATGSEYLQRVNAALESDISRPDWLSHRRAGMSARPSIIDVAREASQHGDVAVLTNNGALIGEHLGEIAPELLEVFGENLFATAHFGARKPDPLVFQRAMDHLGHQAPHTFFVDDLPENVRGAETLGITGHWFSPHHTPQQLRDAIQAFIGAARPRD